MSCSDLCEQLYSPKSIDILRSLGGRAAKSITCTYVYIHLYHMNSSLEIPETNLLAPMPLTGCGYQTFYLTLTTWWESVD
jgi:hypothetical protein